MIIQKTFTAGGEDISGLLIAESADQKAEVLFLHGAGTSNKERALPIAEYLFEQNGIASFLFDFSGHGESTGKLNASSLAKRVREAEAALKFVDTSKPFSLCGFSMGGHISLELMAHHPVKNLALFYPGIYDVRAYNVPFTEEFSAILREKDSWKKCTAVENLKNLKGNLLIVIGENDEVVPNGVIEMITAEASKAHEKEVVRIPGGTHLFLSWVLDDPVSGPELCQKVADYIHS